MLLDQQQNSVSTEIYTDDRFYSDIQFSTEEGENKPNYLTAGAGGEQINYAVKHARPIIQSRSAALPWRKGVTNPDG